MKIKTEIFQSTYIITCEGPSLNPSSAEVFLTAMKALIQKNHLDILFDLSGIEFVEGAKLGTISRSFEAIEGEGRLIICGVNGRDLKLLKMTHMEEKFLLETNRNDALSTLFWERKKAADTVSPATPEPLVEKEEPVKLPEVENIEPLQELTQKETGEKDREDIYEIEYDDIEVVTSIEAETEEAEDPVCDREEPEVEDSSEQPLTEKEQRKFSRIKSRQIMDEEFIVFCKNTVTGKHYTAVVTNIGLSGLLMTLSPPRISEGDELLLEGRIGKLFTFKERAVFLSHRQNKFVFEFIDLSNETTHFLNRLVASLNK